MKIQELVDKLSKNYYIKDIQDWEGVKADFGLFDPPFGLDFDGKKSNYNRKKELVVDGYIEWEFKQYSEKIQLMLSCLYNNLKPNGQALIFSCWNHSNIIHNEIEKSSFFLRGKLYWNYNFVIACKKRANHSIYEIFWITKSKNWYYINRCSTHHCQNGEANLTLFNFKKDYKPNMPKYPTRLPFKLIQALLEHFTRESDLVIDFLAGSGMLGIVSYFLNRNFLLGDLNPNGKFIFRELIKYYEQKIINR